MDTYTKMDPEFLREDVGKKTTEKVILFVKATMGYSIALAELNFLVMW